HVVHRTAYYSRRSHRLVLTLPTLTTQGDDWISKGQVTGISDLSQAGIILSFKADGRGGNKGALLSTSRLISCTMEFGNFYCGLTNFAMVTDGNGFARFQNTLPNAEAILDGTTAGFQFLQE